MPELGFDPCEGGVKVVFDVPAESADRVTAQVREAGFAVHAYYPPGAGQGPGRARAGWVRLGAERAMRSFTDAEQVQIVAEFEAVRLADPRCTVVGVDRWHAGDEDGSAGVREPRRPLPPVRSAAADLPV